MIIGHKKQFGFLKSSFAKKQLSHAFLFCGESHIGKKTFAIEFVKFVNCQNPGTEACGVCRNCVSIAKGNFPDFLFVRSGEESSDFEGAFSYNYALPDLKNGAKLQDKKEIEISQARKVLEFLSLRSYFGNYKAVVIDNSEKLTIEAQNCLLKTLEEPKGQTILILITSSPERLLTTIFSRCQTIKFFTTKEIRKLFDNPERNKKEQNILDELLKVIGQNLAEKFAYTKNIKDDGGDVKEILEILQKHFRGLLLRKVEGKEAGDYSIEKLKDILIKIEKTINDISLTNASSKLALEVLLMEI